MGFKVLRLFSISNQKYLQFNMEHRAFYFNDKNLKMADQK